VISFVICANSLSDYLRDPAIELISSSISYEHIFVYTMLGINNIVTMRSVYLLFSVFIYVLN